MALLSLEYHQTTIHYKPIHRNQNISDGFSKTLIVSGTDSTENEGSPYFDKLIILALILIALKVAYCL